MAKLQTRNRNKDKLDKNGKKKKPNWEWRFEVRTGNTRKNFSKAGFRTQAEALEAGTKALAEYNDGGSLFAPSEALIGAYMDEWFNKYVEVNLRPKTQDTYKRIIDNHIKPNLGHYKLNSLHPGKIQEFLNNLKENGYSRRHIINIHSTLSNALKYAIYPLQYIKTNPAQYVKIPKIEREPRQRIILTPENWERIIKRFPFGNKYHIPLVIGYYTGMRIGEVFALTWEDINFETNEIRVSKSMNRLPNKEWAFGEPKTKSSVRTIKIGNSLTSMLKREKVRQNQNALLYGEYYKFHNLIGNKLVPDLHGNVKLVCVCEDGSMLTTDSFKYCSRVIHHELEIEFDFHSLRHTHATILVENGAPIKDVQKRLGHEKIETTLQTYVHDTEDMQEASVEIFERVTCGQKI
jgi:integrase